ncbi:MAG: thiolase family protein [Rhodospirillaceae bacterium]|jgi:acetyl-CoA acetyltransferase family protein|nr:thiolase family protein [Rhodospirillaceae bacterium]MBT5941627.1 thiolase family protein [Rhodospirillaceae bacterium]MBT7269056.1 thiolase family protein [Rhodospirillaceae bacterium]
MTEVVIIDGVRTPIGKMGGALASVRPDDLLAETYKALIERNGIDASEITEVIAGCGNQGGEDNRDVARMSVLLAGMPKEVPGLTVNRNCSSALEAVNFAAKTILVGEGDLAIGSGVESMSRAPWSMMKPDRVPTTTPPKMWDTTVGWRFNNPKMDEMYPIVSLGEGAEIIAEEMQISREDQDSYSLESHTRAIAAINDGKFEDEIIPISVPQRRGDPVIVDTDEHPRYEKTDGAYELAIDTESLGKLRPAFKKDGSVTAGNSSGINDGAAALLLASREKADALGLKPLLRWVGSASAGTEPGHFAYGPIPATEKLLKRFDLNIEDIGLVELNEAFASQTIGCMRQLGLDSAKVNVNGGAIALGHPTGCSGSRILVTMMHEMKRRAPDMPKDKPFYGLATLCVGVGMGSATLVEWIGER